MYFSKAAVLSLLVSVINATLQIVPGGTWTAVSGVVAILLHF